MIRDPRKIQIADPAALSEAAERLKLHNPTSLATNRQLKTCLPKSEQRID